jgi:hypothetical protein
MRGEVRKGVVIAVYVYDSPQDPNPSGGIPAFNTVYADVLCYGRHQGLIPRCLVPQGGGVHEGRVWKPRAARMDVTGQVLDPDKATNPLAMDGDHVLVGFAEGDPAQPFIQCLIPHPSSDVGHQPSEPIGQRTRLTLADGEPDIQKHRGVYFGVDDLGNYVLDLTQAHAGQYMPDGSEPPPPVNGLTGNVTIKTQAMATILIKLGVDREIKIEETTAGITVVMPNGPIKLTSLSMDVDASGDVKLGTGAGAEKVVLGTTWNANRATRNTAESVAWAALFALLTADGTALPTLISALTPPAPASIGPLAPLAAPLLAYFTALAAATTPATAPTQAAQQAIDTFEAGTYLSAQVSVKP